MILNPDNCHFLTLSFDQLLPDICFNNIIIENDSEEKIFWMAINIKLNWQPYSKAWSINST